jgi:uncharacterized protein
MRNISIIWQITDRKRGHENQSSGLIAALGRIRPSEVILVPIDKQKATWWDVLLGRSPNTENLPKPDLIVGTGSSTHSTILAAGRATGAPTVVIMAPSIGISSCFDLCIIPQHDRRNASNVITTKGAINLIRPSQNLESSHGLFLIGGPSSHHNWDQTALLSQLHSILAQTPSMQWTLTTSRRTPAETTNKLVKMLGEHLTIVPVEGTSAEWLPREFARSGTVWVTEDSVSMVYEALSSGAKVGLLNTPRLSKESRVIRGIDQLLADEQVHPFSSTNADLRNTPAQPPLNEADRVAEIVFNKFYPSEV